jgi:hypothetical protein
MIIGISGQAGSGKDTAAQYLIDNHGFVRIGLADKIKRICKDVFDFSDGQLWGPSSSRNTPDDRYKRSECIECGGDPQKTRHCDGSSVYLTPRYALQKLGTEWGRDCYENIWTEDVLRTAKCLLSEPYTRYDFKKGLYAGPVDRHEFGRRTLGVVIPDVRFKSEMASIKSAGGYLIRMKRGTGLAGAAGAHPSESEQLEVLDNYFDAVIENSDLSLKELEVEVTRVYESLC